MKNILIVYGTTTGNTESMAGIISNTLEKSGLRTDLMDVVEAEVKDLTDLHDIMILGCPAYGDETVELQEDFEVFYEKLDDVDLIGKKFAVFAPGDSSYEHFCGSVDMLEDKFIELGGDLIIEGLKIDGDPDDSENDIVEWVESIIKVLE